MNAPTVLSLLQAAIAGGVPIYLLYQTFAWELRLADNQVTLAPLVLQVISGDDYLLELRREDD